MENHFCCQQQFLVLFPPHLLAKVFKIKGGEEEREQPGPSGQRVVVFPARCAPVPAPNGLCQMHRVPVPTSCCFSMGNVPKVHLPSSSCRNPSLLLPWLCHSHGWEQKGRVRVGFGVLGPRGGVTPLLITLSR